MSYFEIKQMLERANIFKSMQQKILLIGSLWFLSMNVTALLTCLSIVGPAQTFSLWVNWNHSHSVWSVWQQIPQDGAGGAAWNLLLLPHTHIVHTSDIPQWTQ